MTLVFISPRCALICVISHEALHGCVAVTEYVAFPLLRESLATRHMKTSPQKEACAVRGRKTENGAFI